MRKIIMVLMMLLMVSVAHAESSFHKYGELILVKEGNSYGLSFKEMMVLPCHFQYQYNEKLQLLIMYNKEQVYVFSIFRDKPEFSYEFSESQEEYPKVTYHLQEVMKRECYLLQIQGDEEVVGAGIYCRIDGRTHRLVFLPVD